MSVRSNTRSKDNQIKAENEKNIITRLENWQKSINKFNLPLFDIVQNDESTMTHA